MKVSLKANIRIELSFDDAKDLLRILDMVSWDEKTSIACTAQWLSEAILDVCEDNGLTGLPEPGDFSTSDVVTVTEDDE